ncbi:tRNA threonylcarbamoyladenosine dehydratase [Pseudoramibacter faecis]|uniref:tRNA threonylcarbamoyladenosine dehydratase n=1 Tax=Pseudoramibacter faecis TaxID=3108534 RepID=UPI002E77AE48|nr:tRNA threonylcarbamoyladenosine dehydratase [Pseudoramibacter sp. HA2172]
MIEQFSRTALLLGEEAIQKLSCAHIAVFGIGGVGGYVCEALARGGIGRFDLIDGDRVSLSNLNRQIIATHQTIGTFKVDAMSTRIHDINPAAQVTSHRCFYLPESKGDFDFNQYDYIVDAVDTVTAKLALIAEAQEKRVPVIASMGAGNKLDPTQFEVTDIAKTSVDPLAKVIRRECKKRGVHHLKVVYSKEQPIRPQTATDPQQPRDHHPVPGSVPFVPGVVGLIIAGEVIKDLIQNR